MSRRAAWLKILGCSRSSTLPEIKERFRMLAKAHHPDVSPSPNSAEKMRLLTEAYEGLTSLAGGFGSSNDDSGAGAAAQGPAMEARWRIRRRHQASEYPAWFTPSMDEQLSSAKTNAEGATGDRKPPES